MAQSSSSRSFRRKPRGGSDRRRGPRRARRGRGDVCPRPIGAPEWRHRAPRRAALAAYLREHLIGSDAAIDVVERLRLTHAGSQEGRLFASLFDEFREEREVVRLLLEQIGASPLSLRRLAGPGERRGAHARQRRRAWANCHSSGRSRAWRSASKRKRCMWRALESLLGDQPIPSARSLGGLEAMAVRQWEAIEERRRALVSETFPALRLSAMDVPID